MNVERLYSGIARIPKGSGSSPHETSQALSSETMRAMRIKNISEKVAMADFLTIHPHGVKGTKEVERVSKLLECLIVEEQAFEATLV
jgi:hypothetical protein